MASLEQPAFVECISLSVCLSPFIPVKNIKAVCSVGCHTFCLCAFQQDIAFLQAYRQWGLFGFTVRRLSVLFPHLHLQHIKNSAETNKFDGWPDVLEMEGCVPQRLDWRQLLRPFFFFPLPSNHPSTSSWNWTPPGVHRLCDTPTLLLSKKSFQKNSQRAATYSVEPARTASMQTRRRGGEGFYSRPSDPVVLPPFGCHYAGATWTCIWNQ